MAAVAQPMQTAPRSAPPSRERQALSSRRMTALAYLLLLVLGYLLLTPVVTWGQRRLDDLRYSFPRTTQLDGFVGHGEESGDPTHLMALNLRGQINILELPGSDPAQARTLAGPTWSAPTAPMSCRTCRWRISTATGRPICCSRYARKL